MVAKVTQYLQEVLAPTLDHFRVPATYASQIIDTLRCGTPNCLGYCEAFLLRPEVFLP